MKADFGNASILKDGRVVFNIAGIALNVWSIVATYLATESALQQRSMSLGGALGAVRGKFWRYIGVSLLFGLIVLGGSLLLVIPGIYWAISFSLFGVVIALEARGAVGPLRRSRHVVTGAWWRTFGLGWAIGLLYLPVIALSLLSVRQGGATGNPAITHWGLYLLAQGLVLVLSPVTHIISVIWYHALKARQGAATAVTT